MPPSTRRMRERRRRAPERGCARRDPGSRAGRQHVRVRPVPRDDLQRVRLHERASFHAAMRRLPTKLEGPVLVELDLRGDDRGFFAETYRRNVYTDLGVPEEFVQDNHSRSRQGIVRGMHYQPGMAKLVRCARGAIFDVVVDIRPSSAAFGAWEGHWLSDDNARQLYVPDGFAHGFCVLSEVADVV